MRLMSHCWINEYSNLSRRFCEMKTVRYTAVGIIWMGNGDVLKFEKYIFMSFCVCVFFFNKGIFFHKKKSFEKKIKLTLIQWNNSKIGKSWNYKSIFWLISTFLERGWFLLPCIPFPHPHFMCVFLKLQLVIFFHVSI